MPNINLDIWARIHQRSLDKAERDLNTRFQDMGREAQESLAKGVERGTPRVRRAMREVADATGDYTRQVRELAKAQNERAKATAALTARESAHEELRRKSVATAEEIRQGEEDLRRARADGLRDTDEYRFSEQQLASTRQRYARELDQLSASERNLANDRNRLKSLTAEANDLERNLSSTRKGSARDAKELASAENELRSTRQQIAKLDDEIIRRNKDVERSNNRRAESVRRVNEAHSGGRRGGGGRGGSTLGDIFTDIPGVPGGRAGAIIGTGVITVLGSVAEAAVTASQAIALLPAAATAAAAGIGTLMVGMHGFGDTLKHMGDPKKFAKDIQSLSPAAQQAALEIQHLTQGPLKELQQSTQDTLFRGVAEKLHNATGQLLPSASRLTGGVSGSFNNMFGNLLGQLTSPGSMKAINEIVDNIVSAFQKLEPAVAPFTDAMTKIIQTGSSFLPGFSQAITNAANSFSNFITKAQADGSLQNFMQKGVDAAVALGKTIWDIGQKIFEVFGNKSPQQFQQTLNDVVDAATNLAKGIVILSETVNSLLGLIEKIPGGMYTVIGAFTAFKLLNIAGTVTGISSAFGLIPDAASKAGGGIAAAFGKGSVAMAAILAITAATADLIKMTKDAQADYEKRTGRPAPGPEQGVGPRVLIPGRSSTGGPAGPQIGALPKTDQFPTAAQQREHRGLPPLPPPPPPGDPSGVLPPYSPFDVPAPPPKGSAKSRRDKIRGTLDPNSFMPDIGNMPAGMPNAAPAPGGPPVPGAVPPLQYGTNGKPYAKPGYGYVDVDQRDVWNAQYKVVQQARDVRDARMDLAVLEKDNLATQEELLKAREKVADQEHQFQDAQLGLIEAQQGKWKKVQSSAKDTQNKLSAGLDSDLGLSKGLAGLADNLVRFVGNVLTAPLQALLQRVIDANPNEGSGLIGIMAAQGKFGPQWTPQGIAAANGQTGYGYPSAGMPSPGSALPGESARDFAHRVMMPFWQSQGLTVGDHAADKYGEHQNGALDIMVDSIDEGNKVLQQVLSDSNVYGAIFNNKVYGYGHGLTPQDYTAGHTGNPTQDHQDHVHALYKPGGSDNIAPTAGSGVPIVATPGGGWTSPSPAWAHLINRESSGNPSIRQGITDVNSGGNEAEGLFQITPATWRANGGTQYAPSAGVATPQQQAEIAANIFRANPSGSDWGAGLPGREDPAALQAGLANPAAPSPAGTPTPTLQDLIDQFTGGGGQGPIFKKSPQVSADSGSGSAPVQPWSFPALPKGGPTKNGPHGGYGDRTRARQIDPGFGVGIPGYGGPAPSVALPQPGASNPWAVNAGKPFGSPTPASSQPGLGGAVGQPSPQYAPTPQPQAQPQWQPGGNSAGGGGLLGAAAGAAAGMFPGGGAAAQIAMAVLQRSIKYGGEVAGALAQGGLQALSVSDPDGGGGTDWSQSWLGRLAGSMAQAAPALPSSAGKMDRNPQQQLQGQQGQQGQPGQDPQQGRQGNAPLIGNMFVQQDRANAQNMASEFAYASAAAGVG